MNKIDIVEHDGIWRANFHYDFETKELVKSFGWKWRADEKEWTTTDPKVAMALAENINNERAIKDIRIFENISKSWGKDALRMSSAKVPTRPCAAWVAPDGLEFKPYQLAFFEWYHQQTLPKFGRKSLLCSDEMGTGKTVMSAGLFSQLSLYKNNGEQPRFLVMCTAGMKIVWEREVRKWCRNLSTIRIKGTKLLDYLPTENVVIINYDLVVHHRPWIDQIADKYGWDLIVCDEAHYLKNPKAKRTSAILGGRVNFGNRNEFRLDKRLEPIEGCKLFLTGTPLVNRPVELWPILKECDPTGLGENWQRYVRKYCGAFKGRYGWDTSGATNLDELQEKLRSSIMIRRRTNDVLDQLPAIQRQAIILPDNGDADLIRAEWEAYNNYEQIIKELEEARRNTDSDMDSIVRTLRDRQGASFAELAKYRKLVGLAKKDHVIEHCRNVIESRGKIVLFAWHKDVVTALLGGLKEFNPVRFTGSDSEVARQTSVDAFQDNETVKAIVLNLEAGGVGITLTGTEEAGFCTSVVFSELDWRPSIMQQAERRVARLGADESASNILVHHVVLDGSLDATISNRLIDKQNVIDQAIN